MKKQLKEELRRFNQIMNYSLEGKNIINEVSDVETEIMYVAPEINALIEELSDLTPISRTDEVFNSVVLLQSILVDSGYCVHGKVCGKLDGDFGDTTEKSLNKFINRTSLNAEDLDILEDSMVKKATEEGKSYVNTKQKAVERIAQRELDFKEKYNIDLNNITPEMKDYFLKWFRHNKALKVTGENVEDDIVNYIIKKEGGLTDTPTDRAKTKNLKDWFDTKTRILKKSGANYKLSTPNLKPTLSKYYYKKDKIDTYNSNHWHTNKGIVYTYYNTNMGGNNSVESIENWFNLSDEDVRQYYLKFYFDAVKNYSSHPLINHFFAIVNWGSGNGSRGYSKLREKILKKTDSETIDEAVEKLGLPVFFDLLIKERGKQFRSIKDKNNEGGWMNSLINFHFFFYEKYLKPIVDDVDDVISQEINDLVNNSET